MSGGSVYGVGPYSAGLYSATPPATYNFAPSIGETVLNALSRDRIRGPMVQAEHLHMASLEANLMQAEWSNRGPTLWTITETIVPLTAGVATYPVDPTTIMVTNVTIGRGDPPNESELTITPVSRQEFSMIPNKFSPGRPTIYWYDRSLAPTITLWPVPDTAYWMHLWGFGQIGDAAIAGQGQFAVPYRWLDACCAGLAHRLARHYAQDLEAQRKADYDQAYQIAATQDTEDAPLYIWPMIGGYYR